MLWDIVAVWPHSRGVGLVGNWRNGNLVGIMVVGGPVPLGKCFHYIAEP